MTRHHLRISGLADAKSVSLPVEDDSRVLVEVDDRVVAAVQITDDRVDVGTDRDLLDLAGLLDVAADLERRLTR
jgi:hypothetical protein